MYSLELVPVTCESLDDVMWEDERTWDCSPEGRQLREGGRRGGDEGTEASEGGRGAHAGCLCGPVCGLGAELGDNSEPRGGRVGRVGKSLHTVARRALRSCRDRPAARLDVTAKHAPALQSVDVARTCSQCWLSYDL